ncbi:carboxymuconolactone decarboxylase family protein, partial [Ilumatobacter sp.]|uniref:carboxymuconolactone decarboxylase family protein n=1 Tax=Ilumatobacter sp. TaxID=1967498 RepID=UPI0037539AEE
MARIRLIAPDDIAEPLRSAVDAPSKQPIELGPLQVYAHRPEIAAAYVQFTSTVRNTGTLNRRLVELVRLSVAFHNQCRSCMAVRYGDGRDAGVDENLVCELRQPEQGPDLTEAEREALRFADKMANDHLSITDETFVEMRQHFSEEEIVELGMNIALFVGFGRLASAWDL